MDCVACTERVPMKYRTFIFQIYKSCINGNQNNQIEHYDIISDYVDDIKEKTGFDNNNVRNNDYFNEEKSEWISRNIVINAKNNRKRFLKELLALFPKEDHWIEQSSFEYSDPTPCGFMFDLFDRHSIVCFDRKPRQIGLIRIRSHFGQPTYLCDKHICPKCNVNMKSSKDAFCKCCLKGKLVKSCPCFTKKELCKDKVCPLISKLWCCSVMGLPKEIVMYVLSILFILND